MPASSLYHKDPETSNRIAWFMLLAVFVLTLLGFLYSKLFSSVDQFYEKNYYERISGIKIPTSSKIIESFDNGEFWTATSFIIDKDSLSEFILRFDFKLDSNEYKPRMFSESSFQHERLDDSLKTYLYNFGTKGKNSWLYIIDSKRKILWAEIQYPDWAGD